MGSVPAGALRLLRMATVDDDDLLFRQLVRDSGVARTGLAEKEPLLRELISPFAFVWRIEDAAGPAGMIWLDTCSAHFSCLECTLLLRRRGVGIGPSAFLAAVLFAFERLAVSTVCFAAKEYNAQILAMCRRSGIAIGRRRTHADEFDPSGSSVLVEYLVDRQSVSAGRELAGRLLRRTVALLGPEGAVHFLATPGLLTAYGPTPHPVNGAP